MKIALLSNINMNPVIRSLKKEMDIYETEGYGNELGTLMNPQSSIHSYNPDIIFLIEDLLELINHDTDINHASDIIVNWFSNFETLIDNSRVYYISNAYLWGLELNVLVDKTLKSKLENIWQIQLEHLLSKYNNVHIFPYRSLIESVGSDNSFSLKMWYMGKILHQPIMQQKISAEIKHFVHLSNNTPKKLLLLDLDNTLWGGLAGEDGINGITLSDDHAGLVYKNLQRIVKKMKEQGVILGIVSKNNESDALDIIENHPHMILNKSDFAIYKINWGPKHKNIQEIAATLNIGLDSIVFFDDNTSEQQLIRDMLPDVIVADFPDKDEQLPEAMIAIWREYFDRVSLTTEDLNKTSQYVANAKREELKKESKSFSDYLKGLQIKLIKKDADKYVERVTQLLNKTNQFNLTTKRHTKAEINTYIKDNTKRIYVYQTSDIFGDNGIIAVSIVDSLDKTPCICEFVMSCRVMGKNIEYAIIDDIENDLLASGFNELNAEYIKSQKNSPVSKLYDCLGYSMVQEYDGHTKYNIHLEERPDREYYLNIEKEIDE